MFHIYWLYMLYESINTLKTVLNRISLATMEKGNTTLIFMIIIERIFRMLFQAQAKDANTVSTYTT